MWQMWLIISGVFLVIEAVTVGFLVFWFAIGALFAMVTSFFTESILAQSIVFLVSSTLLLLCTRPLVNKFIKSKDVPTNVYSIIGKKGIVTKEIDPISGLGQIKVQGEVWSAKTEEDQKISEGTEVEIIKIDGVKAFVKLIK